MSQTLATRGCARSSSAWRKRSRNPRRHRSAEAARSSGLPPHLARDLDHQPQLLRLLLDGNVIAVHGAREPALRRQGQLIQRRVLRSLFDAALDGVLVLQRAELGRDETEHDNLAFRQEAQRLEVAAALI